MIFLSKDFLQKINKGLLSKFNHCPGNNRRIIMNGIDEKGEKEFRDWLESITFVDKVWKPLLVALTDDESDDTEGDREGS